MSGKPDTEIFVSQIKNTIRAWSDGSLSFDRAKFAYKKLHEQYLKIERKYISENTRGFLKGLLHNHNIANSATLTALFRANDDSVSTLAYAGDAILLNAIPELLQEKSKDIEKDSVIQMRLGEQTGQSFSLFLKRIVIGRETIVIAAVTSTPLFNSGDFELLSEILSLVFKKNRDLLAPVTLNYIHDISSQISRLFNGGKDGPVFTDHFILYNPPGAFTGAGIHNIIDYSHFIINTLKMTYPADAHIFTVSLKNYFVLYDEKTKMGLGIKRNRIDFDYHGNNIPYKVIHTEIGTQQQLYLFLEAL